MKKVNETPERLLIYQDADLAKFNKKTLDEIFSEVKTMKALFTDLGISFNQDAFIKTMNEGSTWLFDILYSQATEMFKKMSDLVKASMVDKDKLYEHISPIEPIIENIKELLNQVNLTPDQVPFDENNPIINNELKDILAERSKRYATGPNEIELYHLINEFAEISNKLEACLAKNSYPLLFTAYTSYEYPVQNAHIKHFAFPLCIADYDHVEEEGHARFVLNPDVFEEYAVLKGASEDFKKNKVFNPQYSGTGVPVSEFKPLRKDAGKIVEGLVTDPDKKPLLPKKRWAGFPGIE